MAFCVGKGHRLEPSSSVGSASSCSLADKVAAQDRRIRNPVEREDRGKKNAEVTLSHLRVVLLSLVPLRFALASAAVIIARLTFAVSPVIVARARGSATGNIGVAALVVTAFVMAAVIVTGFTLATSNTGVAALVVTAFVMAAVMSPGSRSPRVTLACRPCRHRVRDGGRDRHLFRARPE